LKTPYIYLMILYTKDIPFLASKFDLLCMSYLNIVLTSCEIYSNDSHRVLIGAFKMKLL
jgi:hypothetical protein